MEKLDTRQTTDYIKGIAILVVLFTHYTQHYQYDFYLNWISGLARGVIALFFVLSGYGIFYSLERRFRSESTIMGTIFRFYANRALRIYPLYWLALFVTPLFFPSEYPQLHELNSQTLITFLGGQSLDTSGVFWFVPAIIQCYLAAPFLYLLLQKLKPFKYFAVNIVIVVVMTPLSIFLVFRGASSAYWGLPYYQDFIVANIFLFSLGLLIGPLLALYGRRMKSDIGCMFSWSLFEVTLFGARASGGWFQQSKVLSTFVSIFACFSSCLFSIALNPRNLPLASMLSLIGRHSYTLYLFHMAFFGLLASFGAIRPEGFVSDFIALLFLPVFVWLCIGIDVVFSSSRVKI